VSIKPLVSTIVLGLAMTFPGLACAGISTEAAGTALQILIPAVGLGSTLFYEKGHAGLVQFMKAFASSQLITHALKYSVNERRPNGVCCNSFPSGHTSAAFMGAAFIEKRYGWRYAIPAYLGATYVGYSRVQTRNHYISDVIAGALIGTLSSYYFTSPYQKAVSVSLLEVNHYHGVTLDINW
jgi:membrane-associated phospholipid phosphatase